MPASALSPTAVQRRLGLLLVTLAAVAWSLSGVFVRLLHVDTYTMIAWRGLIGALALAIVMRFTGQRNVFLAVRRLGWGGWMFVVLSTAGMLCFLSALKHTSIANVAVIYATAPFVAGGLSWWLIRERPTGVALIASALALAGVALIVGLGEAGDLVGNLLALGMTVSMAIVAVVARTYRNVPILLTACLSSLLSGLLTWPFGDPLHIPLRDLGIVTGFGLINFAVGLPLYFYGARHLAAIETALIGAVESPLAPLWAWLAFGETPATTTLVGGGIVFFAVVLHFLITEIQLRTERF